MEADTQAPPGTRCLRCGAHLGGRPAGSNCAGCGFPIERTLGALPTIVPDSATCIRCAYALRGLSPQSVCPECGTPVDRSLRGDLLAYSDPNYIGMLLTGAKVVLWSSVAIILLVITSILLMFNDAWPYLQTVGLGMLIALAAFGGGWWMITWPDAGQLSTNKGQRTRRVVRYALVTMVAMVAFTTILPYLPVGIHRNAEWLTLLIYPALAVDFWAGMLYLRWLAPRIPDGRVHALAKSLLILFGAIIGSIVITIMLAMLSNGFELLGCLGAILLLGAAVAGLISIVLYCHLLVSLRESLVKVAASQRTSNILGAAT
jgi:hypothetical protein